jgi:antitoxin VapB
MFDFFPVLAYAAAYAEGKEVIPMIRSQQHVRLFRNGRNQAVRIPKEFEMDGDEAVIRKEGNRLVLEPLKKSGLLAILAELEPMDDAFPDVDESLLPLDDVPL